MGEPAIQLDQTRPSRLLKKVQDLLPEGGNLELCLTCGACASGCPASGIEGMDPRKFLRMAALGLDEELMSTPWVWMCSMCQRCVYVCPMKIDIPALVYEVRSAWPREERPKGILGSCDMALRNESCSAMGASPEDFTFVVEDILNKLKLDPLKPLSWSEDDLMNISVQLRKRTKPMIIAANKIDVPSAHANFERIKKEFPGYIIVPCSAETELALREAAKKGMIDYVPGEKSFINVDETKLSAQQAKGLQFIKKILDDYGSTGVQEVINRSVFDLLKYIALYPGGVTKLEDSKGNVIPDCFLMPGETTALEFAYRLHTDFGKNFIRAIDVRTKMTVGKEHVLKDGDIVEIVSGK